MEFLNKKVAILFSSFSRNQDLLPIAYYYLNKNLKINLNIFWGSNGDIIHDFHKIAPNWNYIRTHNVDLGWSQNLIEYLKHISTEYILLMLDDFIILKKPNVELIKEGFKLMIDKNAIYFRLNNNPPPTKK